MANFSSDLLFDFRVDCEEGKGFLYDFKQFLELAFKIWIKFLLKIRLSFYKFI
jgi:hypothetical protein